MSSSSPSLLSSRLPSPATLFTKKPASLRSVSSATARHGVRVVVAAASAAAAAPVSAARVRPSAAEVARTVVELAASGTLSVVGPDGWPLGVGARFVTDAAGAPALCLAAAGVAALDAPSSFHVEVRGRCSAPHKDWVFRGSILRYNSCAKVVSSLGKIQFSFFIF